MNQNNLLKIEVGERIDELPSLVIHYSTKQQKKRYNLNLIAFLISLKIKLEMRANSSLTKKKKKKKFQLLKSQFKQ